MNQKHTLLDVETSSQIIDKIMEDWGSLFIGVTFLHHDLQVIGDIDENGKRCVRIISYCIYEDDKLSGLPIPEALQKEIIDWSLYWDIVSDWDDLSDFSTSDYDADGIKYVVVDWDDPNLPQQVFEEAVDRIDWWAVGEGLLDFGKDAKEFIDNTPFRIRDYLENAAALCRRKTFDPLRYILFLIVHPVYSIRRLYKYDYWVKISNRQLHSFQLHTKRKL